MFTNEDGLGGGADDQLVGDTNHMGAPTGSWHRLTTTIGWKSRGETHMAPAPHDGVSLKVLPLMLAKNTLDLLVGRSHSQLDMLALGYKLFKPCLTIKNQPLSVYNHQLAMLVGSPYSSRRHHSGKSQFLCCAVMKRFKAASFLGAHSPRISSLRLQLR